MPKYLFLWLWKWITSIVCLHAAFNSNRLHSAVSRWSEACTVLVTVLKVQENDSVRKSYRNNHLFFRTMFQEHGGPVFWEGAAANQWAVCPQLSSPKAPCWRSRTADQANFWGLRSTHFLTRMKQRNRIQERRHLGNRCGNIEEFTSHTTWTEERADTTKPCVVFFVCVACTTHLARSREVRNTSTLLAYLSLLHPCREMRTIQPSVSGSRLAQSGILGLLSHCSLEDTLEISVNVVWRVSFGSKVLSAFLYLSPLFIFPRFRLHILILCVCFKSSFFFLFHPLHHRLGHWLFVGM